MVRQVDLGLVRKEDAVGASLQRVLELFSWLSGVSHWDPARHG